MIAAFCSARSPFHANQDRARISHLATRQAAPDGGRPIIGNAHALILGDGVSTAEFSAEAAHFCGAIIQQELTGWYLRQDTASGGDIWSPEELRNAVGEAIANANNRLCRLAPSPSEPNHLTTLALVFVVEPHVVVAHSGDSTVWSWHDNRLIKLTREHTRLNAALDAGAKIVGDLKEHPDRSVLTRCVGLKEGQPAEIQVLPILLGTAFLLFSDALNVLSEDDLISVLRRTLPAVPSPEAAEECARALVEAAVAAGTTDDATAIVGILPGARSGTTKLYDRSPVGEHLSVYA